MSQIEWVLDAIAKASSDKVYGSITLNFQSGNITTMRVEKIEKPPLVNNKKT